MVCLGNLVFGLSKRVGENVIFVRPNSECDVCINSAWEHVCVCLNCALFAKVPMCAHDATNTVFVFLLL